MPRQTDSMTSDDLTTKIAKVVEHAPGWLRDGDKNPTLDVVGRIAAALKVTKGSLVDE